MSQHRKKYIAFFAPLDRLLSNTAAVYFAAIAAFAYIFFLISKRQFNSLFLYTALCLVMYFYVSNVAVILGLPAIIIVTLHLLRPFRQYTEQQFQERFENAWNGHTKQLEIENKLLEKKQYTFGSESSPSSDIHEFIDDPFDASNLQELYEHDHKVGDFINANNDEAQEVEDAEQIN